MKSCPSCHTGYPNNFALCPRDGTPLEAGGWREGSLIRDKYRILATIGTGGMATVYQAEHVLFAEIRAIKVMSPELAADEALVRRFIQEAKLTRRLQHPNAVRVDDIELADDGLPFIVMEYIAGRPLKDAMQETGPMPLGRVLAIVKQVAAALEAAHGLGMVHRDIKPSNILLVETEEGEAVKVLDFGIAKVKEARLREGEPHDATLTSTGMVIGTPAYMSPEQANGKRGDELDGRADLYSLGVVAYQMLTGELPLRGNSDLQMLMAHIGAAPAPVGEKRADLPAPIADLVMRCLAKDRQARPASGRALIGEIEKWEEGAGEPRARRQGATRLLPAIEEKPAPRRWWMAGAAAILCAGLAVWHPWSRVRHAAPPVVEAKAVSAPKKAAPAEPRALPAPATVKASEKPARRAAPEPDDDGMTISAPKR